MILFKIKSRALVIGSCITMGDPKSNISHLHSHVVCMQNISLTIVILFLPFILVNKSCDHRATYKEMFGSTIHNLIRTSIGHPLMCLVMPKIKLITSDRALRSLKFHINSISNAQNPFISQLCIQNYISNLVAIQFSGANANLWYNSKLSSFRPHAT